MLFYVAIGSALGGVSRYLLGGYIQRALQSDFPAGTLLINVSGSLVIGALLQYAVETPSVSPELKALLAIGFCGGYTTFSTFSYETVVLLKDGEWTRAGMYIAGSVLLSLVATIIGFAVAREVVVWRARL
jgi:fluoride exporter